MDIECPYCSMSVAVTSLQRHVRLADGDGHGPHGTVPVDGVDNPWRVRLDVSAPPGERQEATGDVPSVDYVADRTQRGRCPNCELGVLGLKGGSGRFSTGHRRLACTSCGWESPEWVNVRE